MTRQPKISMAVLIVLAVSLPATLPATNGMYLPSYGAEAAGRAGVNLAISDRVLALNSNPAGITQLLGNHYSINFSVLAPILQTENMVNSRTDAEDRYFPLPAFAYVRSPNESPWSWGVGFVGQGGMGATFEGLNTFFGTVDETFTEVRFMTVAPTVAYAIHEDMSIGATLNIGYADASFRFFPNTSFFNTVDPNQSFFGVNMKKAAGLQTNLRLGWWWRPHPRLSVGAIYQTETESNYDDGEMWVNFNAHPFLQQKVKYSADMEGFTFAAQAGVGFALRLSEKWMVAFDLKRYFWDDAIDTITVTATDPDVPGAPSEVILPFVFNWKDQWIVAFGAEYRLNDTLTLRGGYNFGENPVPDETLTPLFPATVEKHLSFGFSWLWGQNTYELALEHVSNNAAINNNPDPRVNPFGPGLMVDHEQWTVSVGISRAWSFKKNRR